MEQDETRIKHIAVIDVALVGMYGRWPGLEQEDWPEPGCAECVFRDACGDLQTTHHAHWLLYLQGLARRN